MKRACRWNHPEKNQIKQNVNVRTFGTTNGWQRYVKCLAITEQRNLYADGAILLNTTEMQIHV